MKKSKNILSGFCATAKKLGAKDAKIISPKNVFTAPWVRLKCQFGCGGYGQTLTCPPYSPKPEETRKMLDCYSKAILIHCSEDWHDIKGLVAKLERKVFLSGYHKAFGMGSGPCRYCSECNFRECTYPEKARPAMEACGIDVFKTARKNGFHIEVVKNRNCRGNYFGLLLVE